MVVGFEKSTDGMRNVFDDDIENFQNHFSKLLQMRRMQ